MPGDYQPSVSSPDAEAEAKQKELKKKIDKTLLQIRADLSGRQENDAEALRRLIDNLDSESLPDDQEALSELAGGLEHILSMSDTFQKQGRGGVMNKKNAQWVISGVNDALAPFNLVSAETTQVKLVEADSETGVKGPDADAEGEIVTVDNLREEVVAMQESYSLEDGEQVLARVRSRIEAGPSQALEIIDREIESIEAFLNYFRGRVLNHENPTVGIDSLIDELAPMYNGFLNALEELRQMRETYSQSDQSESETDQSAKQEEGNPTVSNPETMVSEFQSRFLPAFRATLENRKAEFLTLIKGGGDERQVAMFFGAAEHDAGREVGLTAQTGAEKDAVHQASLEFLQQLGEEADEARKSTESRPEQPPADDKPKVETEGEQKPAPAIEIDQRYREKFLPIFEGALSNAADEALNFRGKDRQEIRELGEEQLAARLYERAMGWAGRQDGRVKPKPDSPEEKYCLNLARQRATEIKARLNSRSKRDRPASEAAQKPVADEGKNPEHSTKDSEVLVEDLLKLPKGTKVRVDLGWKKEEGIFEGVDADYLYLNYKPDGGKRVTGRMPLKDVAHVYTLESTTTTQTAEEPIEPSEPNKAPKPTPPDVNASDPEIEKANAVLEVLQRCKPGDNIKVTWKNGGVYQGKFGRIEDVNKDGNMFLFWESGEVDDVDDVDSVEIIPSEPSEEKPRESAEDEAERVAKLIEKIKILKPGSIIRTTYTGNIGVHEEKILGLTEREGEPCLSVVDLDGGRTYNTTLEKVLDVELLEEPASDESEEESEAVETMTELRLSALREGDVIVSKSGTKRRVVGISKSKEHPEVIIIELVIEEHHKPSKVGERSRLEYFVDESGSERVYSMGGTSFIGRVERDGRIIYQAEMEDEEPAPDAEETPEEGVVEAGGERSEGSKLDQARKAYYEARRQRMRIIGKSEFRFKKGKIKLGELEDAYLEALKEEINSQISEAEKADKETLARKLIELHDAENKRVWAEFESKEKSRGDKIKEWWRGKATGRLVVSGALLGLSFVPPLSGIALTARRIISGASTAVALDAAMEKYSRRWGEKGLTQDIYKEFVKQRKSNSEEAARAWLQERVTNLGEEELRKELARLTVLAERKGKVLSDALGDKMRPVIDQMYQANLGTLPEELIASQIEGGPGIDDRSVSDLLSGRLDAYLQTTHEAEQQAGRAERRKEIKRGVIAAAAGLAVGARPWQWGQGTGTAAEGAAAGGQAEVPGDGIHEAATTGHTEVPGGTAPEVAPTGVHPEVPPTESAVGPIETETALAPEAEPELTSFDEALAAAQEVDAKGSHTVWSVIHKKCESVINQTLLESGEKIEDHFQEGKITYIIDAIKDKVAADPTAFGLPKNIDVVTPEDLAKLAGNDHFNQLVAESFFNPDDSGVGKIVETAQHLSDKTITSIEANNAYLRQVAGAVKDSGVRLDQHAYNLMSQAHEAGLKPERAAEILSSGVKGAGKEVVNFYTENPKVVPHEALNGLIETHGGEAASKIIKAAGGEIAPDSAVSKLLGNQELFANPASAENWVRMTRYIESGEMPRLAIREALKEADLYDRLATYGPTKIAKVVGQKVKDGVLSFTLEGPDVEVKINPAKLMMEASHGEIPAKASYADQLPAKALKAVVERVLPKTTESTLVA